MLSSNYNSLFYSRKNNWSYYDTIHPQQIKTAQKNQSSIAKILPMQLKNNSSEHKKQAMDPELQTIYDQINQISQQMSAIDIFSLDEADFEDYKEKINAVKTLLDTYKENKSNARADRVSEELTAIADEIDAIKPQETPPEITDELAFQALLNETKCTCDYLIDPGTENGEVIDASDAVQASASSLSSLLETCGQEQAEEAFYCLNNLVNQIAENSPTNETMQAILADLTEKRTTLQSYVTAQTVADHTETLTSIANLTERMDELTTLIEKIPEEEKTTIIDYGFQLPRAAQIGIYKNENKPNIATESAINTSQDIGRTILKEFTQNPKTDVKVICSNESKYQKIASIQIHIDQTDMLKTISITGKKIQGSARQDLNSEDPKERTNEWAIKFLGTKSKTNKSSPVTIPVNETDTTETQAPQNRLDIVF